MNWYYIDPQDKRIGPMTDAELQAAAQSGAVGFDTLIWRDGMAAWAKLRDVNIAATGERCVECGGNFSPNDMVQFAGGWVCAACKPQYVQKLREGVPTGAAIMAWRCGNKLVTVDGIELPHRCIKCNEPVGDPPIKRKLNWHTPLIYLSLFAGLLVYVILAIVFRKRATVSISVCPKHRTSRMIAVALTWLLFLGGLSGFGFALAEETAWPAFAGLGSLIAAIVVGIVSARFVYATKIEPQSVWLGGCCREFLAQFPEWTGPQ